MAARRSAEVLPVYAPEIEFTDIYQRGYPGNRIALEYNHDVDIVKFQGQHLASWNANGQGAEDVPGQYNFLRTSSDFRRWSEVSRPFMAEAGAENPFAGDNQWQPSFVNYHDQELFCGWCDFMDRKLFVSSTRDGRRWHNREVALGPAELGDRVVAFPTTHGLLTSRDVMMIPCSLPFRGDGEESAQAASGEREGGRCVVGATRYAGILMSADAGKTWEWSAPIEAASLAELGATPEDYGGEIVTLWEPTIYEIPDGRLGLLIRNCTTQDAPATRGHAEKAHQMIFYAESHDHGRTWSHARPIEVDSIITRMLAVSGFTTPESLLMVTNDWVPNLPKHISHDRFKLALYFAPVCDPDLLLPGPLVMPDGGCAYYPNGFVEDDRLRLGYTYGGVGIHGATVSPLPDFSRPFLLPREGRPGLRLSEKIAEFSQKDAALGLVLTEKLTRQPELRLAFRASVECYDGTPLPLLTLGGKTRQGGVLEVAWQDGRDCLRWRDANGRLLGARPIELKQEFEIEARLTAAGLRLSVAGQPLAETSETVLRKISFGGLYEPPIWPQGTKPQPGRWRLLRDEIKIG